MTANKRFTKIQEYNDDGTCEDAYYDTITFKTYSFCDETSDERFLNDVNNIINDLMKEKDLLERLLECSRGEANDYCEELMGVEQLLKISREKTKRLETEIEKLQEQLSDSE